WSQTWSHLRRSIVRSGLLALIATSASYTARAQAPYPNRSISIVSPLAAGSVSDISLRVIGERLSQHLRVPVVIENQPASGDVDVVINAYGGLRQGIERKEIRALATTTAARIPQLPDIPTVRETGVADFEVSSWNGLYAPVGTPPDVVATLSKAITDVLSEKDIQQRHRDLGLEVSP